MINPKIIFSILILLFLSKISFAQSDTLNQRDANGLRQGYWIVYGKDMPEKNFPADGKIEEGRYLDDRKTGVWIMYYADGIAPRAKGTFVDGRPKGIYAIFDQEGNIIRSGDFPDVVDRQPVMNFNSVNGVSVTYHPSGCISSEKRFNEEGLEHGSGKYYYDGNCDSLGKGVVQFEYIKINGVTVGLATRYYENGSIKEEILYDTLGMIVSSAHYEYSGEVLKGSPCGSVGPDGSIGMLKDGKKFQPDGYNKIYNKADELLMDGIFKESKLWEGKLYKYDIDGILLKVEIWKNGCYYSDGQF